MTALAMAGIKMNGNTTSVCDLSDTSYEVCSCHRIHDRTHMYDWQYIIKKRQCKKFEIRGQTGKSCVPVISADEFPTLAQVAPGSLTLAVSQSGETYDTLKALRYAKAQGSATAAIVNAPGSSMTREVDQVVLQGAGPEICVLSTKSTISQVTILLRLALELARQRGHLDATHYREHSQALRDLPDTLRKMHSALIPAIRRISHTYNQIQNWLFIGRGIYTPVSPQGGRGDHDRSRQFG